MAMNFNALLQAKQAWETFKQNHPNFPKFLEEVKRRGITEGTEVQITVQYPNESKVNATIKVKPSDLQLLELLKSFL